MKIMHIVLSALFALMLGSTQAAQLYATAGNNGHTLFAYDTKTGVNSNLGTPFYTYQGAVDAIALSADGVLYAAAGNNGHTLFAYDTKTGVNSNLGSPFYTYQGAVDALVIAGPPAIPEPDTYAMILAGLGLLGVTTSRKKKTQESACSVIG